MALKENLLRLRKAAKLSQRELADKAGVSQQLISQIETDGAIGRTKFLPELASALGVEIAELDPAFAQAISLVEETQKRWTKVGSTIPVPVKIEQRGRLPVFTSAQGGEGETIVTFEPIDYVSMPEPLEHVRDPYGVYVVGDSMSPAFEPGDLALVNPHVPARGGDDVIVYRAAEGGEQAAAIKRLVRAAHDHWSLRQFNPERKFSLPRTEWPRCDVIVGKYSRR